MFTRLVLLCAVVLLPRTIALAQTPASVDVTTISLEDLLQVEVVSSASKFPQQVTSAPASITVVTSDEIRRLGHRTLTDVLASVRGVYTSDDRNYSYIGIRGFSRGGDYNTRVLVLVDGHRTNDPIYDQGLVGEYLPIDIESIDRVEVIRGAGSSLYGSSAFFAVVNVITKNAFKEPGVRASVETGSLDTRRARASVGHQFRNGADLFVSGSVADADGHASLYFPEFDDAATNFGIAEGLDAERSKRIHASLTRGGVALRGALVNRSKQVPTAAYGAVFGDTRFWTKDVQGWAELAYERRLPRGWKALTHVSIDHYGYDGDYPFDYGEPEASIFSDRVNADWLSGEATVHGRVGRSHALTFGGEIRQSLRQRQYAFDPLGVSTDDRTLTGTWGVYGQDEVTLSRRVTISAGARLDYFGSFGLQAAPRGAVIYRPAQTTSLKVLHGRAFRAPNAYELYYYPDLGTVPPTIEAETIATTEGIWEQYYGTRVRSSVSVFESRLSGLITQGLMTDSGMTDAPGAAEESWTFFGNMDEARARGAEAEIEGRWRNGAVARLSHSVVRVEDGDDLRLTNSPHQLSKAALILPIMPRQASVGFEGQYLGERLTLDRTSLPGVFLSNVTLTSGSLMRRAEISLSVRNLFDTRYSVPGAEEHTQQAIEQDGRTIRARLTFSF